MLKKLNALWENTEQKIIDGKRHLLVNDILYTLGSVNLSGLIASGGIKYYEGGYLLNTNNVEVERQFDENLKPIKPRTITIGEYIPIDYKPVIDELNKLIKSDDDYEPEGFHTSRGYGQRVGTERFINKCGTKMVSYHIQFENGDEDTITLPESNILK